MQNYSVVLLSLTMWHTGRRKRTELLQQSRLQPRISQRHLPVKNHLNRLMLSRQKRLMHRLKVKCSSYAQSSCCRFWLILKSRICSSSRTHRRLRKQGMLWKPPSSMQTCIAFCIGDRDCMSNRNDCLCLHGSTKPDSEASSAPALSFASQL